MLDFSTSKKKKIKNKGFALIIAVGVLAVLVLFIVAFTATARLEEQAARNYSYKIRAKYLAEAGASKAISELKEQAKSGFVWVTADNWYSGYDEDDLLDNCGRYSVTITDSSSQIYLNDDNTDDRLEDILNNLGVIIGGNLDGDEGTKIINNRPAGGYETKEQLRTALTDEEYDDLKDYITAYSYLDDFYDYDMSNNTYSHTSRAPVNVNTAKEEVLRAVLINISDGVNTISASEAEAVAGGIIDARPFSTWSDFEDCLDSSVSSGDISNSEKDLIINNCNPNREKPSTFTTEFSFHAGGYFEIESTGTLYETSSQTKTLAQHIILSVVRTHNVAAFSDKPEFNEDLNYNGVLDEDEFDIYGSGGLDFPIFHNVNWLDSCPVTSDYDEGLNLKSNYETIPGSIKLGFWDDFNEDNDTTNEVGWSYYNWTTDLVNSSMKIDVVSEGNNMLWGERDGNLWYSSRFDLRREDDNGNQMWVADDSFSFRVYAKDPVNYTNSPDWSWLDDGSRPDGWVDAATVECINPAGNTAVKLWYGSYGFLYWADRVNITNDDTTPDDDDDTPREGKDFFDAQLRLHFWQPSDEVRDRFAHIGGTFYGISECTTDHAVDFMDDEDNDDYHGVMPTELTYKMMVSDAFGSPDYRVYLAAGDARHLFYNYTDGSYKGFQDYSTSTTDYQLIPLHTSTEDTYDRYGFYTAWHNGPNAWRDEANGWNLRLYSQCIETKWDAARIIPDSGYYQSPWYNAPEDEVRWAALSWTEIIPSTADPLSETVAVSIDTGDGFSSATSGGSIDALSSQIRFRVDLASNDDTYSQTPVFEDLTFIYIMPTEVLYWREK
jgi:type II secretory pathway component PulK